MCVCLTQIHLSLVIAMTLDEGEGSVGVLFHKLLLADLQRSVAKLNNRCVMFLQKSRDCCVTNSFLGKQSLCRATELYRPSISCSANSAGFGSDPLSPGYQLGAVDHLQTGFR